MAHLPETPALHAHRPAALIKRRQIVTDLEAMQLKTPKADWPREATALMKHHLTAAKADVRRLFMADRRGGMTAAHNLSHIADQLVRSLYDFVTIHMFPNPNPTEAEKLALIAIGGYGRGELAPHSDLDLMFLTPYKVTPWTEQVIETMLYSLWDLGYKVGHSVRSVDDTQRLASTDLNTLTSLLEARYIWGDKPLVDTLATRFRETILPENAADFVAKKLAERDRRHARFGDSRYVVEPNIKDGKGGLRDMQTLWWIAQYIHGGAGRRELAGGNLFSDAEFNQFKRAEAFLWTVRFGLHYTAGRAEERLTFHSQQELAELFNYKDHPGSSRVERFIKHYFYTAKQVGDLTRIFCAVLEDRHQKTSLREMFRLPRRIKGFKIVGGRLALRRHDDFKRDPVQILRIFHIAQQNSLDIHPQALREIKHALPLIDDRVRNDPDATEAFLNILTSPDNLDILRRLNESGVFGRFIPDFGRIVAQMQYDMYHHFTVDEHTIQAVALLSSIGQGKYKEEHPLASKIIQKVVSKRVLYMAVLLHDIAKGRRGDHSILGADVARQLCPRFGFSASDTETIAWLVRWHLLMSDTAFKRDLTDPKTIADFASQVKSPQRLRLLLILTVVDIRAVGPGVWNGWKGQLLRNLYQAAAEVLVRGHASVARSERVRAKQDTLITNYLGKEPQARPSAHDALNAYLERWRDSYWIAEDDATLLANFHLISATEAAGEEVAVELRADPFQDITRLSVFAPDKVGLVSRIVAGLSSIGLMIRDARIHTTKDGMAMDNFAVQAAFGKAITGEKELISLKKTILDTLLRTPPKREAIVRRRSLDSRHEAFEVETSVIIDNKASSQATVIEVGTKDRPGLLYDLSHALYKLKLNLVSAQITTYGERVVDVFYVTEKDGTKINHVIRRRNIKEKLTSAAEADTKDPDVNIHINGPRATHSKVTDSTAPEPEESVSPHIPISVSSAPSEPSSPQPSSSQPSSPQPSFPEETD